MNAKENREWQEIRDASRILWGFRPRHFIHQVHKGSGGDQTLGINYSLRGRADFLFESGIPEGEVTDYSKAQDEPIS